MDAFFGNPNVARQGAKGRKRILSGDVNTLKDPRTYAFASGLLGTAPDEQGFSVMHPDAAGVRSAGDAGLAMSILSALAPVTKGLPVGMGIKDVGEGSKAAARNMKKGAITSVFDNVTDYDEAMKLARKGAHLKQDSSGQYIGAPRSDTPGVGLTVDSPGALANMRRQASAKVAEGASNAAWYDRARATAKDIADKPELQSLFARGGAVYSPQAPPPTEIGAFIRQHNAKMIEGTDLRPRMGAQSRNVAKAYEQRPDGTYDIYPQRISLGEKTGPYADAKDPTIPDKSLYKTANDIWHGRVMGYSEPGGQLFSRGFTPQEHSFLTGENLLLADRAEKAGLKADGASADFSWTPRAAQAATWGAERYASMIKKRNAAKKGSEMYGKTDAEVRAMANAGIDQATEPLVGHQTYEYVTGENTGHMKGLNAAPESVRRDYSDRMHGALTNGSDRDPYFSALQMYQKPVLPIEGSYINSAGVVESNPGFAARPILGQRPSDGGGGMQLADPERKALDATAGVRAVMDAQEGVGWNKFTAANTSMKPAEKTGVSVSPHPDAKQALERAGLDVIDNGEGLLGGSFAGDIPAREIQRRAQTALQGLPGVEANAGRFESGLAAPPWTQEQGTGQVTRYLADKLTNGGVADLASRLDAGGLPAAYGRQNSVIGDFAGQYPPRPDFMRLRQIVADKGFGGLLEHLRTNGYAGLPAAAGMGLGQGLFDGWDER